MFILKSQAIAIVQNDGGMMRVDHLDVGEFFMCFAGVCMVT